MKRQQQVVGLKFFFFPPKTPRRYSWLQVPAGVQDGRSSEALTLGMSQGWNPPSGSLWIAFVVSQGDIALLRAFNLITCVVLLFPANLITCIVHFFGLSFLCLSM